jgi:hypothetical protein
MAVAIRPKKKISHKSTKQPKLPSTLLKAQPQALPTSKTSNKFSVKTAAAPKVMVLERNVLPTALLYPSIPDETSPNFVTIRVKEELSMGRSAIAQIPEELREKLAPETSTSSLVEAVLTQEPVFDVLFEAEYKEGITEIAQSISSKVEAFDVDIMQAHSSLSGLLLFSYCDYLIDI